MEGFGPPKIGVILTTPQIQGWPISGPILKGLNIGLMPILRINGVFYPSKRGPKSPISGGSLNSVFRFYGKNKMSKHLSTVHHIHVRLKITPFWQNGKVPDIGWSPGGPLMTHIHPYFRPIRDGSRNPLEGNMPIYRDSSRSNPIRNISVMC